MFKNILNIFKSKDSKTQIEKMETLSDNTKEYNEDLIEKEMEKQVNFSINQQNNYQINAICPSCNTKLEKMPTRKIKCKECKEQIIVRTHYSTKEKFLLNENELKQYEIDSKTYFKKKKIFKGFLNNYKDVLEKNSSIETALKKELNNYKDEWQWGLFRNVTSTLGNFYYLQNKKIDALKLYTEVMYYDMNEPRNVGKYILENNMQDECPPFKPTKDTTPLPYWIGTIEETFNEVENINLKDLFIEHNQLKYNELKVIPLKPETIWHKIENNFNHIS